MLAVVCTMADAQRLVDPVATLASDPRVQVVASIAPGQVFDTGLQEWLHQAGVVIIPWPQATTTRFDLAVVASASRALESVHAPVALFAHGVGFNKLTPPVGTGGSGQGALPRAVYGLSRESLLRDGRLLAARIALAHTEEAKRLAASCPEAVRAARVVGDGAADRLLSWLGRRDRCRAELGLAEGDRWVVAASTWGPSSLIGARRAVLERLVAEAAAAGWRAGLLVHPNVWAAHGTWQVRQWLRPLMLRGLEVVPVQADWTGVLAAADAVVGDHGSSTVYATLTGRPLAVATAGHGDVVRGSPMECLLSALPEVTEDGSVLARLRRLRSLQEQAAVAAVAARVTSHPGEFASRTRAVLYDLLGLAEPDAPAVTRPVGSLGWALRRWSA
ncbi:hypothetical protein PWG71_08455 [Nocardiopsis sp. N85]|uniref:hypothetical protein n=1 Tax=Nocardiopsis sp. N85 TaxID=3029400 RepID=UPI00237F4E07|nr:hypothetical protein [Nocardiopsis sp. N85]MDE3721418.1 hypothetical protein [Nocardiopsis sp. N85]